MSEETAKDENSSTHVPVTYERHEHVEGPFFHGTKSVLAAGDELVPGHGSKRFPGNPTQSYRTRHPLRVVGEVDSWEGHDPEVLTGMLDSLALLREQGLDVIED
ncbi:NAD(+)--rifampin ADP-ribosyltransferase [Blastococcus sp. CT_GayMR16]|uniref:NAD(+)--rifampin ADP-ribosyltransferase n=1 Tax=Blastococcus sp. CT_GayMR16 TaxID=2559607 RepID=UPI0010746D7D|nr:NAD(+)--rifampin ADP-ribosyltransferase [Blastococcus sp. CT_GayMR16]TFV87457.1 hypothetical protein E4P38_14290 [Blastococcus sp. CT_GayMR16]